MSTWANRFASRARAAQGKKWPDCAVRDLAWWLVDHALYWLYQAGQSERSSQLDWVFWRHLAGTE